MPGMPAGRPMTSSLSGSDDVRVARDGGVVTITLDRPADQNRITRDVLLTLHGLTEQLASDEAAQVVVLTGASREFFSMGILDPAVRASYTKEQIVELVRLANRTFDAIEALPQVVIRSEEHTSELQSLTNLVCRLLLEKKKQHSTKHSMSVLLMTQSAPRQYHPR